MKILFLYTNRNRFLAPPPLGLAMIADSVASSHQVEFLDLMWEDAPEDRTLRTVHEFQPDVIGISLRNLDSQNSQDPQSPIAEIKPLISKLRQTSEALIVLGGTAFTTFPTEILEFLKADCGVIGQGEKVFPHLVEGLQTKKLDDHLPGLVFRKDNQIIVNSPIINGYSTSFCPAHVYYDPKQYQKNYWPGIVLVKTGCPFQCIYCDAHVTQGAKFKLRDPEVIVGELEYQVKNLNTRVFHLSDPCFNTPLDYAKTVLETIIRRNLRIVAMTTLRPDNFDEELFLLMKKAGIIFVALGADTLSQPMLDNYKKGFTIGQVEQCCRMLQKHRIGYMLECVFGGPGETKQTLEASLALLDKVKPTLTLLYTGLRILPQTGLYQIAREEGIVRERAELLFPKFYISKTVEADWLNQQLTMYNKRHGYRNMRMLPFVLRKRAQLWLGQGE